MENKAEQLLDLLRDNDRLQWVAEQVTASFAQGISKNVKESLADSAFLEPSGLTTVERRKREKYETTRPYTESEKVELILQALLKVFVELPAIQVAGLVALRELGAKATAIEFLPPDEPEQSEPGYRHGLDELHARKDRLASAFDQFERELV